VEPKNIKNVMYVKPYKQQSSYDLYIS